MRKEAPASPREAAEALRSLASEGLSVRAVGGATKLAWGRPAEPADVELSTGSLGAVVEHNAADLTAVLRSGLALAAAQEVFAREGQMLALDPPLGASAAATLGGVMATGDSGPLRHRYGAPRDLVLGMQVALADGTLARSGGKVIKNVAGYDLGKLFCGSFGTLGVVCEVVVRLHPLPKDRVTVLCRADDARALQRVALAAAAAPLEAECVDVAWSRGEGVVMVRLAGASAEVGARAVARLAAGAGVSSTLQRDDDALWAEQRGGQRSKEGLSVRVSALGTELARVLRCAERLGARAVGRAALGLFWLTAPRGDPAELAGTVDELRADLAPYPCVVLDAPQEVRAKVDPWGGARAAEAELMRRVKSRFDPGNVCNPGIFVAGI